MKWRYSVVFVLATLCAVMFGSAATTPLAGKRPNIILIITDDQGYGDLSCHGNTILKTPHLDRLHAESARFTDFHVSPTCAPTRSALLTGRHEFHNGVTHTILERERLRPDATTYAQVLKGAGYATGIFGKWHLGDEPDRWPDKRGFGEMFIHGAGGIGQTYAGSCGDAPRNKYFDPAILHNGKFVKTRGYCTDVFFARAMEWIESSRGKGPFYCHISPNTPHAPLDCPPEYEKLYTGKVPPNVAKFYGMIANIDDNVGRLVAKLKSLELERDTLLIFMTDNGTATGASVFNAGMRGTKGTPFQGGTRVPAFWRWPGAITAGDRTPLTAHLDVFQTFAALAGAKIPDALAAKIEGRNLLPLLENPDAPWADRAFVTHVGRWERGQATEAKYRNASIRNARFSLVSTGKGDRNWELFDLQNDYAEKTDVREKFPEAARALETQYDKWWASVQPDLVNEDKDGPAVNSFKELYWKQFPGERPQPGSQPAPSKVKSKQKANR